ncbi:ABC-2 type transporter-domain-containing protein [Hypoxylon sp. FL1857]|nr:ABC-2 type transporter-domain-containing protein [Hypoxylon sp. FL1857]
MEDSYVIHSPSDTHNAQAGTSKNERTEEVQEAEKIRVGVAFTNLRCYGFASTANYLQTFLDHILALPIRLASLFRQDSSEEVLIIDDFEGLILPGEMLLVLGRPGSGCSTFLRALSGETRGFHVHDTASIKYNGIRYEQFHRLYRGERVYVAELDVHFPELTLGRTLHFAAATRRRTPDRNTASIVASLFRLDEAFNTQIGDAVLRGVSGGEKRRTSIAEAYIGGAQFQCWDNSTRGLDSSTALQFIALLCDLSKVRRSTVAMSVYQASENMYNKFDLVTVLYEGRQIYYGPASLAAEYFTNLGFIKPDRATTADFLTSMTNPEERIVRADHTDLVPQSSEEFARKWKQSQEATDLRAKIAAFNASYTVGMSGPATYPLPIYRQVSVCISRAISRMRKNVAVDASTLIANIILGLIIGSVFYNLDETTNSLQQRALLIFFSLMLNAFAPAFEVVVMWTQRPIVEKHHRYAFYHPFTERLASVICDLPIKVVLSLGIHLPVYFLSNLRRTAPAFFIYWVFMLANMITMSMLFRMVGSISKTRERSITPVTVTVLLCIIYTGFVVPPSYMVPWLGWFWRVNPLAYTYESLMINELRDRQFPCSTLAPAGGPYNDIPVDQKVCLVVGSNAGQQSVSGTEYLLLKYEFLPSHLWRNLGILLSMMIIFNVAHLVAAEFIPAPRSRGEVLLFKKGESRKRKTLSDEECGGITTIQPTKRQASNQTTSNSATRTALDNDDVVAMVSSTSAVFHWTNLDYEIKTHEGRRKILHDIHGWVKPGTLTALMGVTGAGKTSLLNVLADRVNVGAVSGQVFVDRHSRDAGFCRKVGYVQQDDIHLPTTTVREALQFSALLRQSQAKTKEEKLDYVEEILHLMDMERYAEAIVGVPGEGLNIEQRKRLTIAVEMVARPELLLFVDEPTSGLDSQTAWSICTLLRKLANNGQSILCTIHQPSFQLFCLFDYLFLLDRGGTTLYFGDVGPNASTVVDYFESNGAPKCPQGENPAEWMLAVTGNKSDTSSLSTTTASRDWNEIWNLSQQKRAVLQQINDLTSATNTSASGSPDASSPKLASSDNNEYAASRLNQLIIVSKRMFRDQWRDPAYLYSKIAVSICIALFNGISFYNGRLDIQGVTNLIFSVFLITQVFSAVNQLVITFFVKSRTLFETRERDSKSYSWTVFVAANIIPELFWQTVTAVPVFAAWYYPTGLYKNGDAAASTVERGALAFILVWLFNLWASTLAQAFAAAIAQAEVAIQLAILFYWLALTFGGIIMPPDGLGKFWIFMYRVSPLTYLLEGLSIASLAGSEVDCSPLEVQQIPVPTRGGSGNLTCGEYLAPFAAISGGQVLNPFALSECQYCPVWKVDTILASFGMGTRDMWHNAGLLASYVCFNMLATFAIYWAVRVSKRSKKSP